MKTIARTALLGLLVSASLQTLAWADDPNPAVANPFAPNAAPASSQSGKVSLDAAPAAQPARVQPTAGHRQPRFPARKFFHASDGSAN